MTDLTQKRLKELLSYDPETGVFRWKIKLSFRTQIGSIAGTIHLQGYRLIHIQYKKYGAHRLAWLYCNGTWPPSALDHINRNKDDNRITNLRLATRRQNGINVGLNKANTSGFKGVHWHKRDEVWQVLIHVYKKKIYLGSYKDVMEAAKAYNKAAIRMHGEFAWVNPI